MPKLSFDMDYQNIYYPDFNSFSHIASLDYLDNDFMLIDNLDGYGLSEELSDMFENYPIKLNCHTVFICVEGTLTVTINLKEYQLVKNQMIFMSANSIIEIGHHDVNTRIAVIALSSDFFANTSMEYRSELMNVGKILLHNPKMSMPQDVVDETIDIYRKMKIKLKQMDNPFRAFSLKSYFSVLCSLVLEHMDVAASQNSDNKDRQLVLYTQFMNLIVSDFREYRDIKHYASELNISPKYFSRLIKNASGKTAGEWIDEFVVLEAKAMLSSRRYSVQQISDALSFPNQSFFAKYFKSHTGQTPSEYKSQYSKQSNNK